MIHTDWARRTLIPLSLLSKLPIKRVRSAEIILKKPKNQPTKPKMLALPAKKKSSNLLGISGDYLGVLGGGGSQQHGQSSHGSRKKEIKEEFESR